MRILRNRNRCVVSVVWLLMGAAMSLAGQSEPPAKTGSKQTTGDTFHAIFLRKYPPQIPSGPHVDAYQKNCLICHSARYVAMQPRFPQAVWEKEIKKMVDAYGAVIPDAEQPEIVEYLVAVHGPTENK